MRHPWLLAAAATVACALGLVHADAVFYDGFGLNPWQVGHTPWALLLQAPLLLLLLYIGGLLGAIDRIAARAGRSMAATTAAVWTRVGWVLLAVALGLTWLVAPAQATWARGRVQGGQTVWMTSEWPRPFQVPAARVAGIDGYPPPAAGTGKGPRLLASSAGRYWLYVPQTGQTVEVPARQVDPGD
jgi:hypothetical protein